MARGTPVALAVTLTFGVAVAAPSPERAAKIAALLPKLDALFEGELKANDYPGMGVGIVLDGELVYARGFGLRDLATRAPFDADTVFRIASVTKGFTAMALAKLRDAGKLSFDAPAKDYFPPLAQLALPTRDSPPVTVRQLMTHASGLPEDNYWVDVAIDMSDAELMELLKSGMTFSRAPETHFEYSNIGYALLGKIIARVSGVPARQYIQREILAPLGMSSSGWEVEEIARERLAVGYWGADGYQRRDKQKIPAKIARDGALDVAGGLYSTVNDMGKYLQAHLAAWPPRDEAERGPVRRASLRELQQGTRRGDWNDFALLATEPPPVASFAGGEPDLYAFSYGGGLITATTCADDFLVEHSGGLPGYSTALLMLPERGYGIVVFVNDSRVPSSPDQAATALFREAGLLDAPPVAPHPALAAAPAVVDRLLATWDSAAAAELFEPTFFAYHSDAQLREEFAKLAAAHGRCAAAGAVVAPSRLRGRWEVACERGRIAFAAALSPKGKPRLQFVRWSSALPPSPRLSKAATAVARFATSGAAAGGLFAKSVDRAAVRVALGRAVGGARRCVVGDALDGDGTSSGVFALTCDGRDLRLSVGVEEKTGKVTRARVSAVRNRRAPYCAM
jgi:CubicO group peptidase (beta-lactamase class C family)